MMPEANQNFSKLVLFKICQNYTFNAQTDQSITLIYYKYSLNFVKNLRKFLFYCFVSSNLFKFF